jgi:hypothetical protein
VVPGALLTELVAYEPGKGFVFLGDLDKVPGSGNSGGAISLSDTHILPIYYTFTTLLWYTLRKGREG